jgi:ferredoxin-NADP reductase
MSSSFEAILESARMVTPSVRALIFRRADGAPMTFSPGQWVNLMLPHDGAELKRSYSIASPPDGGSRFEIDVTRVLGGPGSEKLHSIEVGQSLRAIGPSGLFVRDAASTKPALFVGTGTGVAPLRSMLRAATNASSTTPMWLLAGFRHEEDILYRDELGALAADHPNVRMEVTLSKGGDAWTGRRGYVQDHLPALVTELGAPDVEVYICGLDRMVKSVRDLCRGPLGLGRKQVHQERYD